MNANTQTSQRRGWLTVTVMLLGTMVWAGCPSATGGGGGGKKPEPFPLPPCDDDDLCTTDILDEDGQCRFFAVQCAADEVCKSDTGECKPIDLPPDNCVDVFCDDGNACTTDLCLGDGVCRFLPRACPAGESCDSSTGRCVAPPSLGCSTDADCLSTEACSVGTDGFGTCLPFDPCAGLTCDDGNACTTDICDGTGTCRFTPVDCPAGESCNPSTGTCEAPRDLCVGLTCDDGIFCNGLETCDPTSGCVPGTAPSCDDGVACTDDTCDAGSDSCQNVGDDTLCDDGLFCNGEETCGSTACVAGTPPCSVGESCDEGIGDCLTCLHQATATSIVSFEPHRSIITHPLADGDPDAMLLLTQNWNPGSTGGTYNDSPFGVWYNGFNWEVFNQDFAAMPDGAAFNIKVLPASASNFVHTVTAASIPFLGPHQTVINHTSINGDPNAILLCDAKLEPWRRRRYVQRLAVWRVVQRIPMGNLQSGRHRHAGWRVVQRDGRHRMWGQLTQPTLDASGPFEPGTVESF